MGLVKHHPRVLIELLTKLNYSKLLKVIKVIDCACADFELKKKRQDGRPILPSLSSSSSPPVLNHHSSLVLGHVVSRRKCGLE